MVNGGTMMLINLAIGCGGNMRLIQKIKESMVKRTIASLGDQSLQNVSQETLDELAEMVDRRRAELLAERKNNI